MHFEPIGEQVLVQLLPQNGTSKLWLPSQEHIARQAVVIRGAIFRAGAVVVIPMRQAIQVGAEYLVPVGAILAQLG